MCTLINWSTFFFNGDLLHARLNSNYKAWSYKKKEDRKIKAHRKSFQKEPTFNSCLLILELKPFISYIKGKHSIGRELCEERNGFTDILVTSTNGDCLLSLLVLNLKMSVIKLSRVSFGTPKYYMLQNVCHYQSDHENPNPETNDRITFHLCAYSKLVSPVILNFTKVNPLKGR